MRRRIAGYFAPDSEFWRVMREQTLLAAGPAILVLQVAHPLVGQGVADHSDFRRRPIKRLSGTLRIIRGIVFGDRGRADQDRETLRRIHGRVHGALTETTPRYPAGTAYRATDPELLAWVHLTLMHGAALCWEQLAGPMSVHQRTEWWHDARRLGLLLDVPDALLPATWEGMQDAYAVGCRQLHVTRAARTVIDAVMDPDLPAVPASARKLIPLYAAAMLPAEIRDQAALPWGKEQALRWEQHWRRVRHLRTVLPPVLRDAPAASLGNWTRSLRHNRALSCERDDR